MAVSVTMQSLTIGTPCRFRFADGAELEFNSLDEVKRTLGELDRDPNMARLLQIAWFLARQPDGNNPNLVIGKTLTFDLSANNPIRVQ